MRFLCALFGLALWLDAASVPVRHETINDPVFRMAAYNVNVPGNWKFDGAFLQGSSCEQIPFPVFRMYTPDGLTEVRRYPRLDWTWNNIPYKAPEHPDCLSVQKELSAKEVLTYMMGVLQMAFVRDAPLPKEIVDARQKFIAQLNTQAANNAKILKSQPAVQSFDIMGAYAEYKNGTFAMEANLQAGVTCTRLPLPLGGQKNGFTESCFANIRVVRAPKGQLAATLAMVDSNQIGAGENPDWVQKYMQQQAAKSQAMLKQQADQFAKAQAARQQQFEHSQAVRAQQHQQFLATMQAGTDRSLANARAIANANHTIASDWCDYALDQQTVTGAGGTVKISSSYTQTWTNGTGQYYQTNDPNVNPNGVLTGNWSQTKKVHGDGTPY